MKRRGYKGESRACDAKVMKQAAKAVHALIDMPISVVPMAGKDRRVMKRNSKHRGARRSVPHLLDVKWLEVRL